MCPSLGIYANPAKYIRVEMTTILVHIWGKKCGTNCYVNLIFRSFRNLDEDHFITQFFKVIDKHHSFEEQRINVNTKEWITDKMLNEIHNRKYLHEKALRFNYWNLCKASRNRVTLKNREAKLDLLRKKSISVPIVQKTRCRV